MRCVPRITAFPRLVALLACVGSLAQESVLSHQSVATELVAGEARFDILLPPDYTAERKEPYPLLLWLHGGSSGENQLERRLRAPLEGAWERGTIEPVVVVAPITGNSLHGTSADGSVATEGGCCVDGRRGWDGGGAGAERQRGTGPATGRYWIDWKGGGNDWETLLLTELLGHVRATYHVAQGRAGTLIGGASAGGQGTLRIALRNPETFVAAAALEPGFPPVTAFADLDVTPYGPGALRFLERRFGDPVDVAYWRARHPPTIVIDNAGRLRNSGLQLLVEAGDEDANLTFLGAELVLVRGAAHTGRSVPRRLENVFAFFQRALRPEGPDPVAERHLANAKRSGRYAPRVPNQLPFETVDFSGDGGAPGARR